MWQVVAPLARTPVLTYQFARTLSGSLLIDCCVVMKVTAQVKSKYTCTLNFVIQPILLADGVTKTAAI
ncbi:hypothetical protein BTW15_03275 [Pseudomonas syringae pv. tomato]|uniref:Uncharacterized protein n=11 Tax=Pseudomonas syringae group TaxID=136849 RepID=A0A0Q0CSN8_PSESX|nr:hypothetical protein XJ28_18015 [Pseudomonas syringae pv. tomato]EEB60701.1 hypothetical protein PSPTOT1_5057 [Pseudomonas syringae pv. tomato T1]KPW32974.1 hypothetical protein ALO87_102475 [Pseudomonas syringae pv. apii]KPW45865.1 hypothetical protein ALO88_102665 [Pseudomonas syringae pv. antirrhini]KPW47622.1 hypothetical protein ALO86_102179 [Pseudomonas syringae pv. berberidis]KPX14197.1 hypothetical protein ALO72_103388 [Pseudomonas syringae pv. delphinii]KPX68452.1 hypothetical pro